MGMTVKDWHNLGITPNVGETVDTWHTRIAAWAAANPSLSTPLNAAALEDLETRISSAIDTSIAVHTGDTADAHDASAISYSPTGTIAATDVQAAVAEVASEAATNLTNHIDDATDAHDATAISFAPYSSIAAVNVQAAIQELLDEIGAVGSSSALIFDVTASPYDATPCTMGRDGVTTSGDATFTSASANFTSADIGKQIIIWKAGDSGNQSHSTTIASINSTTSVELTNNPGQTKTNLYYAMGANQTTILQDAIDDARDAGGGTVLLPGWFVVTGLVGRNRVMIEGIGQKNSGLILASSSNAPVYRGDQSTSRNAQWHGLKNMGINGSRKRQAVVSTTSTTTWTTGSSTTITLTDASSFLDAGTFAIGTQRFRYSGKSGNQLTGVVDGREGTTAATVASGATVTQMKAHGVYNCSIPSFTQNTDDDDFDAHLQVSDLYIHDCAGWGVFTGGRATNRITNVFTYFCELGGFYGGADTFYSECESGQCGGYGFCVSGTSENLDNCKAWYSGNFTTSPGGVGFLIEPTSTQPVEGTTNVDIIAQDCKKEGVWIRFGDRVVGNISVSSNGTSAANTYAGLKMTSSNHCNFNLVSTERVSAAETQFNALEIDVGSSGNTLIITHAPASDSGGVAVIGTPIKSGSVLTAGNNVMINGMGGMVTPAHSASPIFDPYVATVHKPAAMTGNVTVGVPANAHFGCQLTIIFRQDATGSRTITWNAVFLNTPTTSSAANTFTSRTFVYDGTNWVGMP